MYRNTGNVNKPFKSPLPRNVSSETSETESTSTPSPSKSKSKSSPQQGSPNAQVQAPSTPEAEAESSLSTPVQETRVMVRPTRRLSFKPPYLNSPKTSTSSPFHPPTPTTPGSKSLLGRRRREKSPAELTQEEIEDLVKKEKELDEDLAGRRQKRKDGRSPQECLKMMDLVFVVDDPMEWHTENLVKNRDHYSALKYFGAKGITLIQERMASGVYYNPFVNIDGQLLKYGVISTTTLEKDLRQWNKIYIAGRLHKPVLELRPPVSASLVQAMRYNRETALRAVLLQEGRFVSKFNLYHGITELSYLGDSRMKMAENPEKTKNIVTPLIEEFDYIYLPLLRDLRPMVQHNEDGMLVQDTAPQTRFKHLMSLPTPIQISLSRQIFRDQRFFDIEETMAELSYRPTLRTCVRNAVSEVVWSSSIRQTLQGLLTAGVKRSVLYAFEKLKKGRHFS